MGAVYDVYLTLKMKDKRPVMKLMRQYIKENDGKGARFNLGERNLSKYSFDDLLKVFLTEDCFNELP